VGFVASDDGEVNATVDVDLVDVGFAVPLHAAMTTTPTNNADALLTVPLSKLR